jgi:hypothetical protein
LRTSWLGKSAGKKDLMKSQFDEQLYYLRVMASSDTEISLKGCGFQYKLNAYVFIRHKPINLDLE